MEDKTEDLTTGTAREWIAAIQEAERRFDSWFKRVKQITKDYRRQEEAAKKNCFAMLWANVEVIAPATYARPPQPVVTRRHKDKQPVARAASELLERALSTSADLEDDDYQYKRVRKDFLLGARGQGRVRYEADFEPMPVPDGEEPIERVKSESVVLEHVHWRDFLHGEARSWDKVPWVAFRAKLTRKQLEERFGDAGKAIPLDGASPSDPDKPVEQKEKRASVWEIWCRTSRKVYFVSCNHKDILEATDPFLNFRDFFPCPRPAYGTLTNDDLIPTPDYVFYQDQAEEIDHLTARIGKLQDALKLVGFYPGGGENSEAIEQALDPSVENKIIPIASWAAFTEKGGSNQIVWLPIKDVLTALQGCIETRRQLIEDVYQITGISDILRGQTDPRETKGAQTIKAQWGSIRIQDRQGEMARFCRDIQRLKAEVMAENFQPQTLLAMSNIKESDDETFVKMMGEVMMLLRDDQLRGFTIDIETDSTVAPDEDAEKQRRTEFLTAMGGFIQQALPVVQQAPQMLPVLSAMLSFAVRGFRVGRELETQIEGTLEQMAQTMGQPQQDNGPDKLEEIKTKGEVDAGLKRMDHQHERQMKGLDLMAEAQREQLHPPELAS